MTQKKDNRLPILDEKARCVCGLYPLRAAGCAWTDTG